MAGLTPNLHAKDRAQDRVLLDFNMKTEPPKNWSVEGYAFGTHKPVLNERQKYALATHSQRYVKQGRMTSPAFTIESDYLKINCAGTYHPTKMAVVLLVDGKDMRSCSPEPGYGFLGAKLPQIRFFLPPDPVEYFFDVRDLRGKEAVLEVRDQHYDGIFFDVKITATDQGPGRNEQLIAKHVNWVEDQFEKKIEDGFLLVRSGILRARPCRWSR